MTSQNIDLSSWGTLYIINIVTLVLLGLAEAMLVLAQLRDTWVIKGRGSQY
jgi:hypothetical protein